MELVTGTIQAAVIKTGTEPYSLVAGNKFQIRTKAAGDWTEQLEYVVPAGKAAVVKVVVKVTETDA